MAQALQREGRDSIAGRRGIVAEGLRAMNQGFVIVRGEEEAPVGVREVLQHDVQ